MKVIVRTDCQLAYMAQDKYLMSPRHTNKKLRAVVQTTQLCISVWIFIWTIVSGNSNSL